MTDNEIIHRAFPQKLRVDVLAVMSILPFEYKVVLNDGQIHEISSLVHPNVQKVLLDGENLIIPTRTYFNEPNSYEENRLTELQKSILNCIYLRHHSGYIRQKRLNAIVSKNHYFTIPYIFHLLGEYVVEIIYDIDTYVDETNIHLFRRFVSENMNYSALIKNRMISYWNEYYRSGENRNIKNYIGQKVFDRLEKV